MIARRSLLVLAMIAGCVAGALYYIGAQRVTTVVAARDIPVIRPLTTQDLELRSVPPDALPTGAISNVGEVVGRVPKGPLWQGQPLVEQGLADDAAVFHTGLALRPGERAVAIPVSAVNAVGGAIAPGARVDVLAVPTLLIQKWPPAPGARSTYSSNRNALGVNVRKLKRFCYVVARLSGPELLKATVQTAFE